MESNSNIDSNQTQNQPAGRRKAALGVTAGVLGGGAIGLLMMAPSLTSAATDEPAPAEPVVAALQDGTDEAPADARPEPGVRLRETLQPLVDDGTISGDQADAVSEHLVENRPEDRRGGHHRHGGKGGAAVAEALGINAETLRSEMQAGNSVADIAAAKGIDIQVVVDAILAGPTERIDTAVENGRLTEDDAADRLAQLSERIEERINTVRSTDG
jgi:polyhydroxyalkanoate synthesis regulator phasin